MKFIKFLVDLARNARDARVGAVGAHQVRDAFDRGDSKEGQRLANQYLQANLVGIANGTLPLVQKSIPTIATTTNVPYVIGTILPQDDPKEDFIPFSSVSEFLPKNEDNWQEMSSEIVKDAMQRTERVENNKSRKSSGWNSSKKIWTPHKSVEGGARTIGYGLKLYPGSKAQILYNKQGFLTEEQERNFRELELRDRLEKTRDVYNKRYGDGAFEKLGVKSQSLLLDKEYNVQKGGVRRFPKLMDAAKNGDLEEMKANTKVWATMGKGRKRLVKDRWQDALKDIDSIETGYYPKFR